MQSSIHIAAPERVEKKSDYLDVLTKIGEAVHTKQCITFKHRTYITLVEDDVDKPAEIIINLTPCAIVTRPEGNIVVWFSANTFKDIFRAPIVSRDEQDPFRKGDRVLYLAYVSNISNVEITDDKPYRNEEALNEIYTEISDMNGPVVEGPINFSQLRKDRNRLRNTRYAILFSSPKFHQTIVNYFEGRWMDSNGIRRWKSMSESCPARRRKRSISLSTMETIARTTTSLFIVTGRPI